MRSVFVPRSLSSTESLRQLSEQLNGLVAQVQPHFGPSVLMIFWGLMRIFKQPA